MEAALALQAEEAGFFFRLHRMEGLRGVDVAHRDIALFPERVVGQVILLQVAEYIPVGPVGDRVDFPPLAADYTLRIDVGIQEGHSRAACRLGPAQAGKPAAHVEFPQGALHGLHFVLAIVGFDASQTLLPFVVWMPLELQRFMAVVLIFHRHI